MIPEEERRYYDEKVVYLSDSYQANDSKRRIAELTSRRRAESGLPQTGFVFCCFNNSYKFSPAMFDVWMRLLHAVEGSVMWMLKSNDAAEHNLRRESQARGLALSV